MTEKKAKRWAGELLLVWMVLYNWYRFDYYNEKSILGTVLHGCGKLLHIPMKRAYGFYEKLCKRYDEKPLCLRYGVYTVSGEKYMGAELV